MLMISAATTILRGAKRGVPMTGKIGKEFYKGTRTGSTGEHTIHGTFIVNPLKVRRLIIPNLADFKLTPYVAKCTPKIENMTYEKMLQRYLNSYVQHQKQEAQLIKNSISEENQRNVDTEGETFLSTASNKEVQET